MYTQRVFMILPPVILRFFERIGVVKKKIICFFFANCKEKYTPTGLALPHRIYAVRSAITI